MKKAKNQMKQGEFGYASHDIRIGLEIGVKCVIAHSNRDYDLEQTLDKISAIVNITSYLTKILLSSYTTQKIIVTHFNMIMTKKKPTVNYISATKHLNVYLNMCFHSRLLFNNNLLLYISKIIAPYLPKHL